MSIDQNATSNRENSALPDREKLKSDAAEMMDKAKHAGQQQLDSGKQAAAAQSEKVAGIFEQASEQLKQSDLHSLAEYANQLGNTIKNFSTNLRNRSIDDLLQDTQQLARRNPAVFLLGSVAIGVAISRFFKASAQRKEESYQREPAERSTRPSGAMEGFQSPPTVGPSLYREHV